MNPAGCVWYGVCKKWDCHDSRAERAGFRGVERGAAEATCRAARGARGDAIMKRFALTFGLAAALGTSGCFPGYYGGRANLVGALWTAAVIGLAVHIAVHDAH